jgi:hypothetical protein
MEIEGKNFQLFKSPRPLNERPRSDKICTCQIGHMEKVAHPDHKDLIKLFRTMANIPFELNMKYQNDMQVQITEAFEVSYFDNQDHKFIKMKADNSTMAPEDIPKDTGVKMTVFMVLNKDDKGDKQYGTITMRGNKSG